MGKNSKYFTAQELMERWQVNAIDLCMLFPKICPTSYSTITGGKYDTKGFVPTTAQLNKTHFSKAAVLEYETQHPELKPQDAPYVSPEGLIPPYLDKKDKFFSKELSIAIETWLAMYGQQGVISKEIKPDDIAHKPKIEKYLKKYDKGFSKEALQRIATMINARKAGASKTE